GATHSARAYPYPCARSWLGGLLDDLAHDGVPRPRRIDFDRLLDALPQSGRDLRLGLVEVLDQFFDLVLDDGLFVQAPVGVGERLVVGDDLGDAVLVELALDQRDQRIRGERIQLDTFTANEDVNLLLGRAVSAQRGSRLARRGDRDALPLQALDV